MKNNFQLYGQVSSLLPTSANCDCKLRLRTVTAYCVLSLLLLPLGGCQKYDDSALREELNSQAQRIADLEAWQATVNRDITALQELVLALRNQRYIIDVSALTTEPGGWIIPFNTGAPITISNGAKGDKGDDGVTPDIGVKEDPIGSGVYYWTLNGNWLNDEKIPVTGKDGKDGNNGTGINGVTPKLRINANTNYWQVCYTGTCDVNNDTGWENVLDNAGQPVNATGPQGAAGTQGDAIFSGVNDTHSDYVVFTLAGGGTITLPKYRTLGITFTQPDVFANSETKEVPFTLTGGATIVKVLDVLEDWTVAITLSGAAGTFTVTAPGTWNETNYTSEALVFVSDAAGNPVMCSLKVFGTPPSAASTPPFAASTQQWTFGEQTWSDAIHIPECNKSDFEDGYIAPHCRSYSEGSNTWYYYNWPYVHAHAAALCPSPWRVPSRSDILALIQLTSHSILGAQWGYGGFTATLGAVWGADESAHYWTSTEYSAMQAYLLAYSINDPITCGKAEKLYAKQVRCVK